MTSTVAATPPEESPTAQDLSAVVEQTWRAHLDDAGTAIAEAPRSGQAVEVTATISITGGWNGHVVIGTSSAAATMVAAKLLDTVERTVVNNDISDGLGELATIVAGNLTRLLPEPCALSLPWVVLGPPELARYPATELTQTLTAVWREEPVTIAILGKSANRRQLRAAAAAR